MYTSLWNDAVFDRGEGKQEHRSGLLIGYRMLIHGNSLKQAKNDPQFKQSSKIKNLRRLNENKTMCVRASRITTKHENSNDIILHLY